MFGKKETGEDRIQIMATILVHTLIILLKQKGVIKYEEITKFIGDPNKFEKIDELMSVLSGKPRATKEEREKMIKKAEKMAKKRIASLKSN